MTELVSRVRQRLVDTGHPSAPLVPSRIVEALIHETDGVVDDTVFASLRHEIDAELTGAGPLEQLLAITGVTDVLVNAPDSVWLDRGHGLERVPVGFADEAAVRRLAQRLATAAGRRLDDAMPFVDAALPDGTRLHAVLPPLARATTVSLRVLARRPLDLVAMVARGAITPDLAELLDAMVRARLAFVISGGTGAGKTTLLGALLELVAPQHRVVIIEDAAELVVRHPHVVRLTSRTANIEGAGAIGMRELVRQALRMRPDRLVVGEFRGAEVVEVLVALNTGHEGGAATMHANSASDVPARFVALGALAGLDSAAITTLVASAVDVVVHMARDRNSRRAVTELAVLHASDSGLVASPAWSSDGGSTIGRALLADRLAARHVVVPASLGSSAVVLDDRQARTTGMLE